MIQFIFFFFYPRSEISGTSGLHFKFCRVIACASEHSCKKETDKKHKKKRSVNIKLPGDSFAMKNSFLMHEESGSFGHEFIDSFFFFLLYFGLKRSVTWFTDYTFSFTKQEKHL